ncbi:hypothetical protein TBLA_0C03590 [Henningerozyma blattae CBS 6284]|uniref:Non-structural maintenance of chromosomes element 1 homolog n=1 Tax=Henningerozyma blattae (strain ATCC 34711 / CBS 6284 / DSM 70876 / NBRC 10599 / NRRL Y-10934 / UCD 77-7) TaxID=1071380 RepID=I2H1A9_HENB6|nr:hypothetical protein TBLA_0C03590 [Tetrapisispora blattae CBS 6284]CCH60161.1 hypothetical protein TBLA_0C03590 [Tetrapisispora blattae CBS 6284]
MESPQLSQPSSVPIDADTDALISRHLLRYIMASEGICHENMLLLALYALNLDYSGDCQQEVLARQLQLLTNNINLKLNPLGYKIIQINHPLGKEAVNASIKNSILKLTSKYNISFRSSSKFYVYVNTVDKGVAQLATRFTAKEISYIRWCLEMFCNEGNKINEVGHISNDHAVVKMINEVVLDNNWNRIISYRCGSTELTRQESRKNELENNPSNILTASESEKVLTQMCSYKWFYRTSTGKIGMALRCFAEIQDYLKNIFGLPCCTTCSQVALQGVMCGSDYCITQQENRTVWHPDCFRHQYIHVNQNCPNCNQSLHENGIYIL